MARNRADKYTDKTFSQLESQISRMYKEAQKDINQKLLDFTKRHRAKDREMKQKLKKGEITQEQYNSWMTGQIFIGNQWKKKKEQIAESIKHVMQEASNVSRGKAIDVFAENANYTAFQIEKDLGAQINFGLYDANTVSRLIRDEPELLPRKVVNGKKLEAWNQKVIANSISQGIIQGESIDEISKRIARNTCISAGRSSTLYARTAVTGAQNAGRMERLHEAKDMGINVKKRWMATLDNRTRDSHARLDGETIDVDEKFSNGLMYPGDPSGDPSEVYNCRCTLVYIYPGYEQHFERTAYYEEGDPEYDPWHRNYETVRDMTYEQWVEYKQNQIRARYGGEQKSMLEPEKLIRDEYDGGEKVLEQERQRLREIEEQRQEIKDQRKKYQDQLWDMRYERSQLDDSDPRKQELTQEISEISNRLDALFKKDKDLFEEQSGYFHAKLVDKAESQGIEYSIPTKLKTPHTVQEIIDRVGGGDMTQGSCASLGFCYIGQTEGYNVLDFRDGASRKLFSGYCEYVLRGISRETGKPLLTESTNTGTGGSVKLIKRTTPGHEYYFVCGRHAAIVRSNKDGRLEYLELQSRYQNGWKLLGYKDDRKSMDYTFTHRFGCSKSINGVAYMMDIEDMKNSKLLHRTLGYINTQEDQQKKGASGHER